MTFNTIINLFNAGVDKFSKLPKPVRFVLTALSYLLAIVITVLTTPIWLPLLLIGMLVGAFIDAYIDFDK